MSTLDGKQIKELRKELANLDYKYDTNNGGCCFVAFCLARELENKQIPFKVVFQIRSKEDMLSHSYAHVLIRLPKKRLLNAMPQIRHGLYNDRNKVMTSKELKTIYDTTNWNDAYETKYNGVVAKRIKAFFKNVTV